MKRQLTYILSLFSVITLGICQLSAQTSVGINTQTPNPNAVLELVSPQKNQGLLITSLSDNERNSLGNNLGLTESGLMIFNTSDTMFYFWTGRVWHKGLADLSELYEITSTLTDSSTSYYNGIKNLTFNTETNTFDISVLKSDLTLLKSAVDKLIAEQNLSAILAKGNDANNKISKLSAPTDALDAANKQYVDDADGNLSAEIAKTNSDVTQLTDRVTQIETTVSDHETRITNNTADIATNTANISSVSNRVTVTEATLTDHETRLTQEESLTQIVRDSIQDVYAEVLNNRANLTTLRDSVKTNFTSIDVNKTRIKELSDSTIAEIAKNNARAKRLNDSINYVYKTGKTHLPQGAIYIGGANDTATTVIPSGDILIDNATGDVQVQAGAISPTNMAGITTNGNIGEVLVSKADGTFEWQGKFAGGMSDDLDTEHLWIGDASKKAAPVAKSDVPLSGFAPASADVALGNGTTNYKLVNVLNPTSAQDAATKKYVDDSLSVFRDSINTIFNTFEKATFVLGHKQVYVGDANDTARAVSLNGHVAIVDATGKTEVQPGVLRASNLGADVSGTSLSNGTANHILTSNGDGSFKWTDLSTTPVDPANIPLSNGKLFVGNSANEAEETAKNTIPLSGFAPASADVALGNGTTNYKLVNVLNPTSAQDAATKKYVDDSLSVFRDSINTIFNTFEKATFVLGHKQVYVGDANDTARAVSLNGHVAIVDATGKTEVQPGVLRASNLGADVSGTSLSNGTANHILTSKGDGSFKWTDLSTTPVDPANIPLSNGKLFVGNSANEAEETAKNTIPLSGFAPASADVALGNGTTNYKLVNVLNPTSAQDAATKKYVDDSLSVFRDSINTIFNTFEKATFVLGHKQVYVGDANDTARAVSLNGHVAIVDATGKTEVQPGVLRASNLGADVSGTSLSNGTANHILTSKGDGSFKWTDLSTTPVDPANIPLSNGKLFVGNSANEAEETAKNTIPLSGFAPASADVALGNGTTNYKLVNVLNPTSAQDAATKKYVDDSLSVFRDSINTIFNTFEKATFVLGHKQVYVGDANDTARAVSLNGHVALVDATGKTEVQPGVLRASNMAADLSGTALVSGTTDYILTANGDGTFKWTNPSTTPVDPNNITLNTGYLFVGNGSNKAQGAAKNTIPLSGFASAAANVDMGSYKLTNLQDPTSAQDAATKAYVDAESVKAGNLDLATGAILIGNGLGKAAAQTMSGDVTLTSGGISAIGTEKVTSSMIKNGDIATEDIANNAVTYAKMQSLAATSKLLGSSATIKDVQEITLGTGLSMTGSTLNGQAGTLTNISIVSNNGFAGTVATSTTTPAITLSTTVTGLLKGDGTAITSATAGTDYALPTSTLYVGTTSIALNRASAAQSLTGITSIDGSAATLTTPRAINGVNFNGSAGITVPVNSTDDIVLATPVYPLWTAATGNSDAKISTTKLSFVPSTGILTATGFAGNLTGNVTGNVTGTAANVTGTVAVANGGTGLTSTTANQILYSSAANTIAGLPTANGGILNTSASGVPSITATPIIGVAGSTEGTITLAGATSGTVQLKPTAAAGAGTVLTLPASSGTLALTNGSITTDNVPRWDGNKLINSSIWCNTNGANTRLYLGSTTVPASYDYNLEVAGTFKTAKIYHSSDVRWKKNIQTVNNALDKVQKLRGVTYEWRTTEFPDKHFSEGTQIGLIAQEVEKVLPELVNTGTDGYKAVEYANIVSVLVEAIKEQQALISKQEAEIAKLQADVSANATYMQQIQTMQVQMVNLQNQIASLSSLVQLMSPTASSKK